MITTPDPWTVGPVTRTDFVRYQGASGDMNPIHHDEEFARAAGFPTPFAVGMWLAGLVGTYATDWLGAENVRRFRIRFVEQVWPGDEVTVTCEDVSEVRRNGVDELDLEFACTRLTGGRAVTVWATFTRPYSLAPGTTVAGNATAARGNPTTAEATP